jgi:hypothetical protein
VTPYSGAGSVGQYGYREQTVRTVPAMRNAAGL